MALYSYIKKKHQKKTIVRIIAALLIGTGCLLMLWTLFPIILFEIFYTPKFSILLDPLPDKKNFKMLTTEVSQLLGIAGTDYTKASMWFPKASGINLPTHLPTQYSLSIPKLKIREAQVIVGGDDLSKSLIHFAGPLPGNFGNTVIFGHSTIIWLYDPESYKSIFTKLSDLEIGDQIYVKSDEVTFAYQVEEMKIVIPEDISILEQLYDNSYITLVTCVPPGTYLKRLVVKTKLIKI